MKLLGSSRRWFFGVVVLFFFLASSSCSGKEAEDPHGVRSWAPPALPSTVEEDEQLQQFLSLPVSRHEGKSDTGTDGSSPLEVVEIPSASELPMKQETPDRLTPSFRRLSGAKNFVGSGSGPGTGHAGAATPSLQHHHRRVPTAFSLLEEEARLKAKTKIVVTSSNTDTASTVSPLFLLGGSIGGFALIFCLWYCSIFVR